MTGLWTLNGLDLYTTFGAALLKGSYDDLLSPASPRKRLEYEYIDQDGVNVDTTTPLTYAPKRFTLKLALKGNNATQFWARYNALFSVLSQPTSFTLYIADLDKTFTLLYEGTAKAQKLTPISSGNGKVFATFEIKVLEPLTETIASSTPELIVTSELGTYLYITGTSPFQIIDNKLYLNID